MAVAGGPTLDSSPCTRPGGPPCPPESGVSGSVWLEAVVEPGIVLEHEATLLPVTAAHDHDEGCHEPQNLEVIGQLRRVPDLPVLGFQILPGAGLGIDLDERLAANGFGRVG